MNTKILASFPTYKGNHLCHKWVTEWISMDLDGRSHDWMGKARPPGIRRSVFYSCKKNFPDFAQARLISPALSDLSSGPWSFLLLKCR